jgi:DTW domain-containing protein YfiP
MAEFEPLKPSNTGWLVADVLPDTTAFSWSRKAVDPALLALLDDPQWQPCVVFPGEFAAPERVVTALMTTLPEVDECAVAGGPDGYPPAGGLLAVRPLFVLLDGTWSEARKIFRKSPYLDRFPVLSLQPAQPSTYRLRKSSHAHHFCTAEVAALCLALAGDRLAAETLDAYLAVFSNRYLQARQSVPPDPGDAAHRRLQGCCK